MGRKSNEIKIRLFVPCDDGGYKLYEELTAAEQEALQRETVARMGKALNDWYSVRPGQIKPMLEGVERWREHNNR